MPGLLVAGLGLTVPSAAEGQIADPLVTDRPSFTASALTVAPRRVQLEFGYTYSHDHETISHSIGEALARIGLVSGLELRLALNSYVFSDEPSGTESGFTDIFLGAKVGIAEASPTFSVFRPAVALLVGTSVPTGQNSFGGEGLWPQLGLLLGWSITKRLSVSSNLYVTWLQIDGERSAQFSGSLLAGYSVAERWGVYLEWFGFASSNDRGLDTSFLNTGVTFLASADVQFDARLGLALRESDDNYFLGLGFAWRI